MPQNIVRTDGYAPKVLLPFLALIIVGLLLVIVGVLIGDDTLRPIGYATLGSALGTGAIGYAAPPAGLVPTAPTAMHLDSPSDHGLSPEALAEIDHTPTPKD